MKNLLFVMLLVVTFNSHAAIYVWRAQQMGVVPDQPTPLLACELGGVNVGRTQVSVVNLSETWGQCRGWKNGSFAIFGNVQRYGDTCPDGRAFDSQTGACVCPSGQSGNIGVHVGYVGADGRAIGSLSAPTVGDHVSYQGCKWAINSSEPTQCYSNDEESFPRKVFCEYPAGSSGQDMSPAPELPPPNTTPDGNNKCPAGTTAGGVDSSGTTICVGSKPDRHPDAGKETTTKTPPVENPDGSVTETEVTKRINADGSETTTTRTTHTDTDGSVTIDVQQQTGKRPDAQDGKPDDEADFCDKNPHLSICKTSNVSGSCENLTCEGDPIQCQILRETARQVCMYEQEIEDIKDSNEYILGKNVSTGLDPMHGDLPSPNNLTPTNLGAVSADGWLGAGSCFADVQFSVQGRTITIPFSSICDYLLVLRAVIMVIAGLASWRMLAGTFLRSD